MLVSYNKLVDTIYNMQSSMFKPQKKKCWFRSTRIILKASQVIQNPLLIGMSCNDTFIITIPSS